MDMRTRAHTRMHTRTQSCSRTHPHTHPLAHTHTHAHARAYRYLADVLLSVDRTLSCVPQLGAVLYAHALLPALVHAYEAVLVRMKRICHRDTLALVRRCKARARAHARKHARRKHAHVCSQARASVMPGRMHARTRAHMHARMHHARAQVRRCKAAVLDAADVLIRSLVAPPRSASACVRVLSCVRARACVRVRACVRARACVCAREHFCAVST
jgi:hypothetical protein